MGPWHPPAARLRNVGVRSRLALTSRCGECSRIRRPDRTGRKPQTSPGSSGSDPASTISSRPARGRSHQRDIWRMTLRRTALAIVLAYLCARPADRCVNARAAPRLRRRSAPPDRPWTWPLDPVATIVERVRPPRGAVGLRGIAASTSPDTRASRHAVDDGVVTLCRSPCWSRCRRGRARGLRSTYEPVTAAVSRGDPVAAGQLIGVLQGVRSHCLPAACLHLGARGGESTSIPRPSWAFRRSASSHLQVGRMTHRRRRGSHVAPGSLSSAATRQSPAASGRASIRSPGSRASTTVSTTASAAGHRSRLRPAGSSSALALTRSTGTRSLSTTAVVWSPGTATCTPTGYSSTWATGFRAGQTVGTVGSDGWSTACHLHFTVASDGRPVDPLTFVPSCAAGPPRVGWVTRGSGSGVGLLVGTSGVGRQSHGYRSGWWRARRARGSPGPRAGRRRLRAGGWRRCAAARAARGRVRPGPRRSAHGRECEPRADRSGRRAARGTGRRHFDRARERGTAAVAPCIQRSLGRQPERDGALLAALAEDSDHPAFGIDVVDVEGAQLTDADAGAYSSSMMARSRSATGSSSPA